MKKSGQARNLEELVDQIDGAAPDKEKVSVDEILDMVGHRSFGPLLLVAGLVAMFPVVGDVPGISACVGLFVLLISVQLLFKHEHFWLPQWLLKRSVNRKKLHKTTGKWLRPFARFVDRFIRPRLKKLTSGPGVYATAIICTVIALGMPAMEFVPFSANAAGAALAAFGLSIIAHDGLLAVIAFVFTALTFTLAVHALVG